MKLRLLTLGAAVTSQLGWLGKIIPEIDTLAGTRAGEPKEPVIFNFSSSNNCYPPPALLTMQMMERSSWEVVLEVSEGSHPNIHIIS